jgi:hypothetical protein
MRPNDNDWRVEQDRGANPEATQRSIAISLKRIADALDRISPPEAEKGGEA